MADQQGGSLSRRDFLRRGSMGVLGGGALCGAALAAEAPQPAQTGQAPLNPEERNKQPGMKYCTFGKTNLLVSRCGFGCYSLLPENRNVLEAAVERGVNLVHISPEYTGGRAIKALGGMLRTKRDRVFLILKVEPELSAFERCLRDLRTDHVDILMPPVESAEQVRLPVRRHRFNDLKARGRVRFLGLTCHSRMAETIQEGTRLDYVSVLMSRYNPPIRDELDPLLLRARNKGIATMAMKLFQDVSDPNFWSPSLKDLYRRDRVDVALLTFKAVQELDRYLGDVAALPDRSEAEALGRYVAAHRGEMCRGCAACEGACPNHAAIPDILRFSRYYLAQCGEADSARRLYRALPPERTALACRDCGACERACPSGLPIRRYIREAHHDLA